MHGLMYLVELMNNEKAKPFKAPTLLGWFYLLLFHTISLIAFRALNAGDLFSIYNKIIFEFQPSQLLTELHSIADYFPILLSGFFVLFLFLKELNEEFAILNKLKGYETFLKPAFYISIILIIFVLGKFNANEFIYFQF